LRPLSTAGRPPQALVDAKLCPPQLYPAWADFYNNYKNAMIASGDPEGLRIAAKVQAGIADCVFKQFKEPYTFPSVHNRMVEPYNYFEFGQRYVGSLIDFSASVSAPAACAQPGAAARAPRHACMRAGAWPRSWPLPGRHLGGAWAWRRHSSRPRRPRRRPAPGQAPSAPRPPALLAATHHPPCWQRPTARRPPPAATQVLGFRERWDAIDAALAKGENVVLLANHQTEADPGVFAHMLATTHPRLSTQVFYVAGDRVVSDPL
jgi:hypothetical protein